MGDGVRLEGVLYVEKDSQWPSYCVEVRNVGFQSSPELTIELISHTGAIVETVAGSSGDLSLPAGESRAYNGIINNTVDGVVMGGKPTNNLSTRIGWTDSFGEYNHVLLLTKVESTEVRISPSARQCDID